MYDNEEKKIVSEEPIENENTVKAEEPVEAPKTENAKSAGNYGGGTNPDGTYRHVYAEPWREPAYRPTEKETGHVYSPNHYNPKTYTSTSEHIRNYETKRESKEAKKAKKKGNGKRVLGIIALILVCAIISSATGFLAGTYVAKNSAQTVEKPQVVLGQEHTEKAPAMPGDSITVTGEELDATSIYTLACKQVVGINTSVNTNVFGQESTTAVSGSGFVISEDGYIMTNYHVVQYAVEYGYKLEVLFYDGSTHEAKVVGYDAENDIAVVKIDASGLNVVTLGSMPDTVVGEKVYAVGNPLGELAYSMTEGIVSALDREIVTQDTKINMFQISAAVNSGNSGGPVYNSRGEVIGVVTAKYASSGVEGLGFAIPVDDAVNIATQLIETGRVSKAQLGISIVEVEQMVNEPAIQYLNIPDGAWVYSVNRNSAAEKAGVLAGDIITSIEDTVVTDTDGLKTALKAYSVGDTVTLTVFRDSVGTLQIPVTLEEAAAAPQTSQNDNAQIPNFDDFFGY